jgi:ADP-ribose pyrophosphatase
MKKNKPHIDVVAAVIVAEERILCVKRGEGKHSYTSDRYEFPGGKVEEGETREQALEREISEELGIGIEISRHLITVYHNYPDFSITLHAFICKIRNGDIVLNEHKEYKWLLPEQLQNIEWAAADKEIVETISKIVHQ